MSRFDPALWKKELESIPTITAAEKAYVLDGITHGFDIGFTGPPPVSSVQKDTVNIPFTVEITSFFTKQLRNGFMFGPYEPTNLPPWISEPRFSPVFGIQQTNKVRPIINYSREEKGRSINSEIPDSEKEVEYISFRGLCELMTQIGKDGFIWVADAADAYLSVPVKESLFIFRSCLRV